MPNKTQELYDNLKTVRIGGGIFTAESKIEYNKNYMKAYSKTLSLLEWVEEVLVERDQLRTFTIFSKAKENKYKYDKLVNWLTYDSSDEEFIYCIVKIFDMGRLSVFALNHLHEAIAKLFYKKTKNATSDIPDIKEGKETYLQNYGPELTKLKNISWKGYNSDKIKGFCVYEPVVRIKQLLEYPIDRFADLSVKEISFPDAPFKEPNLEKIKTGISKTKIKAENRASRIKNACESKVYNDLYKRIESVNSELESWESYYHDLTIAIEKLVDKFDI